MYLTTRRDPMYNLFNEMFRSPFFSGANDTASGSTKLMKTNIRENEGGYVLDMELPGFAKEDIQAELKDGYLTVTATKKQETTDEGNGKYIRKECFEGTCKRSFYVGDYLKEEDIKAAYQEGILKLEIPKEKEPEPVAPKMITIE